MKVVLVGPFSAKEIHDRMKDDLTSMGYDVQTKNLDTDRFVLSAAKDRTPLDCVLGRQQVLTFTLRVDEADGQAEASLQCRKRFGLDKILCLVTGPFLFLINWVFMFLCFGNQNNTVGVAERSLQNYADKLKNEYEKTE